MSKVSAIGHRFCETMSAPRYEQPTRRPQSPRIKAGSLNVYEAFNGFYLYGQDASTTHQVCLGSLGDGCDTRHPRTVSAWGSEAELAEAYGFILVSPPQPPSPCLDCDERGAAEPSNYCANCPGQGI